jgi:hypothetical protein
MYFLLLCLVLSESEVIAKELESSVKNWVGYVILICFHSVRFLVD